MSTARIGFRFEVAVLFEEVCDEARKLASFDIGVDRFPQEDGAGELGVSLQGKFRPFDFRVFWLALANGV